VSFNRDLIADLEARKAVFFADFKDKNSIEMPPSVDRALLKLSINFFSV
jgi:hypothetical protein